MRLEKEDVKLLIDEYGEAGVLKCLGSTSYDPITGNTLLGGPDIDITFVIVSSETLKDFDIKRRALQQDQGLDKFAEGRVLFYLEDNITSKPSETGHITSSAGVIYNLVGIRPYIIQGEVVAYEGLHRGVRDGF